MAVSGDLKVLSGAFAPHPKQPFRRASHLFSSSSALSSSSKPWLVSLLRVGSGILAALVEGADALLSVVICLWRRSYFTFAHVKFGGIHGGRSNFLNVTNTCSQEFDERSWQRSQQCSGIRRNSLFPTGINQETEGFILNAVSMSFFERLNLAWRILFPTPAIRRNSNANIAKQRLKMILFSDRCAVSDEAKQKIVSNIVGALSDFVEIDSEDKVQLSVSTDPDLGTVYSVTVPVRRVKPKYRDYEEYRGITNIEYKDTGGEPGTVDVRFDFSVSNDKESCGF